MLSSPYFQPIMGGITSLFSGIGSFISAQRNASAMEGYYEAVAAARMQSYRNAQVLTRASNEAELKLAELRSSAFEVNANVSLSNAMNTATATLQESRQGNRIASFKIGEARNAFASAGVALEGSAAVTSDSITRNTLREVQNNFKEGINKVNAFLTEQSQLQHAAAMERYTAKVGTAFRQARVDAMLG